MTLDECTVLLTPFVLACRVDFDVPTFKAYHRILKDVPATVAEAALEQLSRAGSAFMPSAPEILIASERQRRQQLALHPWSPCAECEDFPGYRKVLTMAGQQETREKCPCKARHRAWLEDHGLAQALADLPGESGAGDEKVYPTVAQLPEGVRAPLLAIASTKVLR